METEHSDASACLESERARAGSVYSDVMLIEAFIELGDGSEPALCQVAAIDRTRDAARRFVQSNELPSAVQTPLTAYLKSVEQTAEKFPVRVHGSLREILQKHGGGASKAPSR
eukprot:TRINITY_DN63993_c0_g1_i3.p1 TRINITY_DN63993_c0_g1~~TRINITY_DN63993_c0_g1_i3.p1  ORF type:complete len:113 (+),score=31.38 TRINITY_DN63993_c0_g1_i3:197-535(+)